MVKSLSNNELRFLGIAGGALSTTMLDEMESKIDFLGEIPVVGSRMQELDNAVGLLGGAYVGNEIAKNLFDVGIGRKGTINNFWFTFGTTAFFNAFASEMSETATGRIQSVTDDVSKRTKKSIPSPSKTSPSSQIITKSPVNKSSRNSRTSTR